MLKKIGKVTAGRILSLPQFLSSSPFPISSQHSLSHSLSRALSLPTRVISDAVARPRGRGWPRMLRLMDWSRLAAARPAPVAAQGGQAGASGPGGQPRGGGLTPRQRCGIRRRTPPPRQRDVAAPPPPRWPVSQIGA